MNLRNLSAIIMILGFIGCFGLLLGVICGLEGYQNAGIDLFMIGFVNAVIGGQSRCCTGEGRTRACF